MAAAVDIVCSHVELTLAIGPQICVRMREALLGKWEIAGYVVFASDGSRVELSRTGALEKAYSPAKKRKKKLQRKKNGKQQRRANRRAKNKKIGTVGPKITTATKQLMQNQSDFRFTA